MQKRWPLIGVVLLATVLGGCLGFFSGVLPDPPGGGTGPTPDTSVVGYVLAPGSSDVNVATATGMKRFAWLPIAEALAGNVPVAGATVQALEIPSLNPIGDPVETDSEGRYTLSGLPEGIEVMIVAVKDTPEGVLRFSTYVPQVSKQTVADADPATSLAAETLAAKLRESSTYRINEDDWRWAVSTADRILTEIQADGGELDFTIGGSIISGDAIGNGIQSGFREDYPEAGRLLPEESDPDVSKAKDLVDTLRGAGYSMGQTIETQLLKQSSSLQEDVVPHLEHIFDTLSRIVVHLGVADYFWDLPGEYVIYEDESIERIGGVDDENTVIVNDASGYRSVTVIEYDDTDETEYLTVYLVMNGPMNAEYILEMDTRLEYDSGVSEGTITAVLNDDVLGEPATLSGDLSLERDGGFIILEDGTDPTVAAPPTTIHLYGYIETGLIDIDGAVYVKYTETEDTLDAFIDINGGMVFPEFTFYGGFIAEYQEIYEDDGYWVLVPELVLIGSWQDREDEVTRFEGDLRLIMTDIESFLEGEGDFLADLEITFTGSIEAPGEATVELETTIFVSADFPEENWGFSNAEWIGGLRAELAYSRDTKTLDGVVLIGIAEEQIAVKVELISDAGLTIEFTYEDGPVAEGSISLGEKVLAEITVSSGVVMIDYVDGTFETLF